MKSNLTTSFLAVCLALFFWPVAECRGQASTTSPQAQQASSTDPVPKYAGATSVGSLYARSRNSLIFSIDVSGSFDDNVFRVDDTQKQSDTYTNIAPRLAFQREFRRSTLAFDYSPSGQIYNRFGGLNRISHDGGLDLTYSFTPRWQWSVNDRINASADPNGYFRNEPILGPLPPEISPNNSLEVRRTDTIRNTVLTSLSYQLSRRSQLTWEADYSLTRFQQQSLSDMNRYGSSLTYAYQLSRRTTVNLGYTFSYFENRGNSAGNTSSGLLPGIARTHLGSLGISRQLTARLAGTISLGAVVLDSGSPGSLSTQTETGHQLRTYPNLNGSLTAQADRTFFTLTLGQNVSDGYGLTTVAKAQSAGISLGRQLGRRATAAVSGSYSRNMDIQGASPGAPRAATNYIYAGPYFRIAFTERLNLFVNYRYSLQRSSVSSSALPGRMTTNVALLGISYQLPVFFRR